MQRRAVSTGAGAASSTPRSAGPMVQSFSVTVGTAPAAPVCSMASSPPPWLTVQLFSVTVAALPPWATTRNVPCPAADLLMSQLWNVMPVFGVALESMSTALCPTTVLVMANP